MNAARALPDESAQTQHRVLSQCLVEAPYQEIDASDVVVRTGGVSEMIQREALRHDAAVIVAGSRGRGGLSRLVLGSTGAALMRTARTPVLFVPSTNIDIVSVGDTAALTCGSVLAAVDLDEACEHQLRMAARLAALAHGPLLLMTVAQARCRSTTPASACANGRTNWRSSRRLGALDACLGELHNVSLLQSLVANDSALSRRETAHVLLALRRYRRNLRREARDMRYTLDEGPAIFGARVRAAWAPPRAIGTAAEATPAPWPNVA